MKIIVNLSSIHTLHPIYKSVAAFKELCNRYSPAWRITQFAESLDKCLCRMGIFGATAKWAEPGLNWGWVIGQNLKDKYFGKAIIDSYKLGTLNTAQFLNEVLETFSFMKDEKIEFTNADIDRVWNEKNYLVSLQGITDKQKLTHKQIALALLESAWNAMIEYKAEDEIKFNALIKLIKTNADEIYIISNTNELQVRKILDSLRKHHPEIPWAKDNDVSSKKDDKAIEIAPKIFLYLSYRVGAYKTAQDNKAASINSTPALLKSLVETMKCNKSEIQIISQFPKDLEEARNLGVFPENVFNAKDFYPSSEKAKFKIA